MGNKKPVKLGQQWSNRNMFGGSEYQMGRAVLNSLQFVQQTLGESCQWVLNYGRLCATAQAVTAQERQQHMRGNSTREVTAHEVTAQEVTAQEVTRVWMTSTDSDKRCLMDPILCSSRKVSRQILFTWSVIDNLLSKIIPRLRTDSANLISSCPTPIDCGRLLDFWEDIYMIRASVFPSINWSLFSVIRHAGLKLRKNKLPSKARMTQTR